MKFKRPIYRILFYAAWVAVLGGIAFLVIAANSKTGSRTCKGIAVSINGDGDKIFVEKADVLQAVERTARGPVTQKHIAEINLGALERTLETNHWIRDAELYFDTRDVLHVSVWERQPFARVFNTGGASFYIDSSGYQLPLLENYSVKLPVVTGFPAAKKLLARDSVMLQSLKQLITAVNADPFWSAQVGQIDITPQRKFELVPLIGSHVIRLGYAENVQEKLHSLLVFYKQVLPRAGLAKYSALDAEFDGQIVAVRRGSTSPVDSLQLQRNIEELMKKKEAEQEPEDAVAAVPVNAAAIEKDSVAAEPTAVVKPAVLHPTPEKPKVQSSAPVKAVAPKNQARKPASSGGHKSSTPPTKKQPQKPKAVMPTRVQNEY